MARSTRGAAKRSASPSAQSPPLRDFESSSQNGAIAAEEIQEELVDASLNSRNSATAMPTAVFGGHLTEEIRQAIIEKHEQEPDMSQVNLTEWLNRTFGIKVNRTTVGRTLQRTRARSPNVRRVKKEGTSGSSNKPKKLDLDEAVYNWYLEKAKSLDNAASAQDGNPPVLAFGVSTFREKACELARTGKYEIPPKADFTEKWLSSFLKRFNLQITALPVFEVGGTVEESSAAASNIAIEVVGTNGSGGGDGVVGGSSAGSEEKTNAWPNELFTYLAPENEEDEAVSESAVRRRVVKIPTDTPHRLHKIRWNSAQHVTEEMRVALMKKREEEPAISQHQLAGWLNATYGVKVHRATIGRNLKRILTEAEGGQEPDEESPKKRHRKRSSSSTAVPEQSEEAREGDFEAVEGVAEVAEEPSSFDQALLDWFSLEKSCGRLPTDKQLLEKARALKKEMNTDETATPVHLNAAWRNDFKCRHSLDYSPREVHAVEVPAELSMNQVHASVDLIRKFVLNSEFEGDTKKDLLQGLDDIYIKLGDANKKVAGGNSPTRKHST